MGNVIMLEDYRAQKALQEREQPPPMQRPSVGDDAIWSRDYSSFEDVVFGIITIRQVLDYHLHYSEEWKFYLLSILDNAYRVSQGQKPGRLQETVELLKAFVAEEMNVLNRKDMSIVLLLLDLISKGATDQYRAYH